jgi:hypothetical protein
MTIVLRAVQWLIDRLIVSYRKLDEVDAAALGTRAESDASKK